MSGVALGTTLYAIANLLTGLGKKHRMDKDKAKSYMNKVKTLSESDRKRCRRSLRLWMRSGAFEFSMLGSGEYGISGWFVLLDKTME